jgi:hypothetical protein
VTDLTKASEALDKAWYELEADALASDGCITDRDVKDAIKRNRARVEAAVRSDTLADVAARLPEALHATLCGPHGHPSGYDATTAAAILAHLTPDR